MQPNVFPIPEQALVFPNQSGGLLQATNFRSRVFKKVIREAIGPRASFSPHCLRHTWASLHLSRGTPIKWVQTQGGWTTAKVLLDTYSHFMPSEMHGFADALAAGNGTPAAPAAEDARANDDAGPKTDQFSWVYEPGDSSTGPRSPIMHFTLPPPFFRNSETSTTMGVTPRSRIWSSRRSETPPESSMTASPKRAESTGQSSGANASR
ncbi:MAG: tyrosine-type recombinase/integrase [Deltaproteobacteria bacterium]|nr:tyrosine-type recombinase/integrase [Deltaproteobacteria bacterium]